MDYENEMRQAITLAENARGMDEVPVGAILLREGLILGQGYNQNIGTSDPTAHAEILALREGCAYLQNYRLCGPTTLFVTLEPCPMCFYALVNARVETLVFGASDPKTGYRRFFAPEQIAAFNHQIQVVPGVLEETCSEQLREFFREKRERGKRKWMRDKGKS